MKHIFEGNWIYLAHESQIPNVNDYFTTYIGRQPIVISRDKEGELNALINACSHRGAMLCRRKTDNRTTFTCPFHGWTFNNSGKLLKVKDPRDAGYPEQFNNDGSHDLTKVARFESYRGFLFGSLNPDVVPLAEHLGDAAKIIDMIVDQSPEGLEVLRGSSTYTYDGNWKLQAENGADGYHVSATHWNYAATTSRRTTGESATETKAMDAGEWAQAARRLLLLRATATCCCGPSGPTRRTGRCATAATNWRGVRRGPRRLDDAALAQPVPLPERLPDGPVRLADPALPADLRRQDRGHHLLHRAQGRERRGARRPHPPVRGLLQRHRHGHPGRPRGVPLLPEDLPGRRRPVERHEPRRHALDRRARTTTPRRSASTPSPAVCKHRGRGPLPDPARLLGGGDAKARRADAAAETIR